MGILLWIIFGSLMGYFVSKVIKTKTPHGVGINLLTGVIGALIGGWFMSIIGNTGGIIAFNLFSFVSALLGAALLVAGSKTFQLIKIHHT